MSASTFFAPMLAAVFPERHGNKRLARAASASERMAAYWRTGTRDMSASRLWEIADNDPAFRAELQRALAAMDARQAQSAALSAQTRRDHAELRVAAGGEVARRDDGGGGLVASGRGGSGQGGSAVVAGRIGR